MAVTHCHGGRQCHRGISEDDGADFVMQLGARGVINRKNFSAGADAESRHGGVQRLAESGAGIRQGHLTFTGKGNSPDIVFEHPGESTFRFRCCGEACGMGDLRAPRLQPHHGCAYLWMHQKCGRACISPISCRPPTPTGWLWRSASTSVSDAQLARHSQGAHENEERHRLKHGGSVSAWAQG
jgi:hypothetical protein